MVANLKLFTPIGSTLVGVIFLALDKISRQLETPFENTIHDIPLTSITQTIESNPRQQLREMELSVSERQTEEALLFGADERT
jgi:putative membrane protein